MPRRLKVHRPEHGTGIYSVTGSYGTKCTKNFSVLNRVHSRGIIKNLKKGSILMIESKCKMLWTFQSMAKSLIFVNFELYGLINPYTGYAEVDSSCLTSKAGLYVCMVSILISLSKKRHSSSWIVQFGHSGYWAYAMLL